MAKVSNPPAPQKVDYNDAVAESKVYFDGDDLAATVWVTKYALKDSFGNIYESSPRQMHERIAAEIARIERKYPSPMSADEVFDLLDHFRYVIPQGGPMTGIGNNFQVASLSNCFVIGHKNPADSYGGIFRMDEEQVQLMKRRGGVGHDLSHLRPTNSPVLNSALTVDGHRPLHGALLELHARGGAGRPPWRPDDDSINQAPRLRSLYRCQDDSRQSDRSKCISPHRRRLHECGRKRHFIHTAVPRRCRRARSH